MKTKTATILARIIGAATGLAAVALVLLLTFMFWSPSHSQQSGFRLLLAFAAVLLFTLTPAAFAAYGLLRLRPWALWLEILVLAWFSFLFPGLPWWLSVPVILCLLLIRHPYMRASSLNGVNGRRASTDAPTS